MNVPAQACDTHAHVFGLNAHDDRYGGFEAYLAMHHALGIERGVIIASASFGTDNSVLLDTLQRGAPDLRGVIAAMPTSLSDSELARMHELGARGVRINQYASVGPQLEQLEAVAERIAGAGWHIEIAAKDLETFLGLRPRLEKLGCPVVFGMFVHVKVDRGVEDPGFQGILSMLRDGLIWQKLSHGDRVTIAGSPFDDLVPFGRAFVQANPAQCLWGTDWPHTGVHPTPEDDMLLAALERFAPDAKVRNTILVDNAARLYGF